MLLLASATLAPDAAAAAAAAAAEADALEAETLAREAETTLACDLELMLDTRALLEEMLDAREAELRDAAAAELRDAAAEELDRASASASPKTQVIDIFPTLVGAKYSKSALVMSRSAPPQFPPPVGQASAIVAVCDLPLA